MAINPVNQQIPQDYSKYRTQQGVSVSGGEKFSLETGLGGEKKEYEGVVYEKDSEKNGSSATDTSSKKDTYSGSFSSGSASSSTQADASDSKDLFSMNAGEFLQQVKKLWSSISAAVSHFFTAIWKSEPLSTPKRPEDTTEEATKKATESETIVGNSSTNDRTGASGSADSALYADLEAEEARLSAFDASRDVSSGRVLHKPVPEDPDPIRRALRDGRQEEFQSLLSQNGTRIPARNTSILTQYDASGRIVEMDPSETHRILHSDRNARNL